MMLDKFKKMLYIGNKNGQPVMELSDSLRKRGL